MPEFGWLKAGLKPFRSGEPRAKNILNYLQTGAYKYWALALSGLSGWSTARAVEPVDIFFIQKGPVVLKPQFDLHHTFNDNIAYREEDKESDLITTVSPGLTLQLGDPTFNFIDLTYLFDRMEYLDRDDLSANQHRAALVLRFEKNRFLLEGRDTIEQLASPLGGGISLGGAKVERLLWDDQYRLTYSFSDRTSLYTDLLHTTFDYESGVRLYDSLTLIGTLGFEYKAFSRTSFFGEVYYGMTENEPNLSGMADYPTAEFVGGFVGMRGNFTEKLTGMVKAGFEHRTYRDDGDNSSAPVVDVNLTANFTERTILGLTYSRRQRESVQFARSTYISDAITANLVQHLGNEGRLRANLRAMYSLADYEASDELAADRKDNLLATGLTITYDIKLWLRVFGSYDFEYLDSPDSTVVDYAVNRATLGLELGF